MSAPAPFANATDLTATSTADAPSEKCPLCKSPFWHWRRGESAGAEVHCKECEACGNQWEIG